MASDRRRKLVLLRHAKSAWPDVPDHERPLGPRGRRDAPAAGRWLRELGYVPDHVMCSTAVRARETWQLAATELGQSIAVVYEHGVYRSSASQLLALIRHLPRKARTVLVVGHDPAIPELALALAGAVSVEGRPEDTPSSLRRMSEKFPTAATAVFEISGAWSGLDPSRARLASFATPRDTYSQGQPGANG
jgi:phosphohistidine phosphatase